MSVDRWPFCRVQLTEAVPLAKGRERRVFRHPLLPGVAVKVMRRELLESKFLSGRWSWLRRRSRLRQHTLFLRELREYLALRARRAEGELPLVRVIGLVETDQGLGLLTELLEGDGPRIAPSLHDLKSQGRLAADELLPALERFGDLLLQMEIVVNDLNASNVVAVRSGDGELRLVLVDGFGDKHLLPVLSISRTLNRRNTRRRLAALKSALCVA